MARLTRGEAAALVAAAVLALAMPSWLLRPDSPPLRAPPVEPRPLVVPAPPPLSAAFARPLFAEDAGEPNDPVLPANAPQLVGVVGRIGSDAVALVRTDDGRTRTLAIGAAVDGWTLESLAIDAAFFTRGGQRVRVPLPAG